MVTVVLSLVLVPLLADSCLPLVVDCHPTQYDLNCDGQDFLHCQAYDLDGAAYGDCLPDGLVDDFWGFYDGNFDGIIDCDSPFDFVIEAPDGLPDGTYHNPGCDKTSQDLPQGANPNAVPIVFFDSDNLGVISSSLGELDLVRGDLLDLTAEAGFVNLGAVNCLAENVAGSGYVQVVDAALPPPGEVFFYAARWTGSAFCASCVDPYGYGECLERVVPQGGGDCELVLVSVAADPETLPPGGGYVDITALVTNDYGNALQGIDVVFSTTRGSLASGGAAVPTGIDGKASDVLTTTESAWVRVRTLVDNPRDSVRVTVSSP